MKKRKISKQMRSNIITYGIVIAAYIIVQTLINAGSISSLMEGLMVPLCIYAILAVSLNLVVGILGELSLGHAGFMCVGAFASAFFSKCMRSEIESASLRFFLALLIGMARLSRTWLMYFISEKIPADSISRQRMLCLWMRTA